MSSTITSASTLADCEASYLDNAGYAENNSVAQAAAFVTACRALLLKMPAKSAHGKGGSVEFNLEMIQRQLTEARAWLAAVGSPDVVHPSFGNFRDYPPGSAFDSPGPFNY